MIHSGVSRPISVVEPFNKLSDRTAFCALKIFDLALQYINDGTKNFLVLIYCLKKTFELSVHTVALDMPGEGEKFKPWEGKNLGLNT